MLFYVSLTKEDRKKLFSETKRCPICNGRSGKRRLVVDHCHRTGIVRGVICERCNSWLGVVEGRRSAARKRKHANKISSKYGISRHRFTKYLEDFKQRVGGIQHVEKSLKKWEPDEVMISVTI